MIRDKPLSLGSREAAEAPALKVIQRAADIAGVSGGVLGSPASWVLASGLPLGNGGYGPASISLEPFLEPHIIFHCRELLPGQES